jgi:putative SOS response-associated peptidase YedK
MPLILAAGEYDQWLDTQSDPAPLIRQYPLDDMVTWPVSMRVNTPKNDDAAILDRIETG